MSHVSQAPLVQMLFFPYQDGLGNSWSIVMWATRTSYCPNLFLQSISGCWMEWQTSCACGWSPCSTANLSGFSPWDSIVPLQMALKSAFFSFKSLLLWGQAKEMSQSSGVDLICMDSAMAATRCWWGDHSWSRGLEVRQDQDGCSSAIPWLGSNHCTCDLLYAQM